MKIRIGIDPGKNGYLAINIDSKLSFYSIPKIGKEVDYLALYKIIKSYKDLEEKVLDADIYCVIEDVHAIYGSAAGSTFAFGYIAGAIEAFLISCHIPYTKVAPKKWQKLMWEGVAMIKKPSSTGKTEVTDTKAMSLIAAKRMFPEVDFRDTERCKNPHDGKVDSTLISEYCRRNF